MCRTNGNNSVNRFCNRIDSKWLGVVIWIRLCENDAAPQNIIETSPADRVFHFQFERAISLFRDNTGSRIGEGPQSVRGKCCFIGFIKRNYRIHHLGVTSTDVIFPVKLIVFRPGLRAGNIPPEKDTFPFRFVRLPSSKTS